MTKHRVVVVARPGLESGFALAGVSVVEAADGDSASRWIERLDAESKVGVVVIDDQLYEDLSQEVRRRLRRQPLPVIVPLPGPRWTEESTAHEYIVEILQRAIGYRVRLR